MLENSLRGARRPAARRNDRKSLFSKLVIIRGVAKQLPAGARANTAPEHKKLLGRREEPIPNWRLAIDRPKQFVLTVYPTTVIGPGRAELNFQVQLLSEDDLPYALQLLNRTFFGATPLNVPALELAVTNVQRQILLLASASFNLLVMRDPNKPQGTGISVPVEERCENTEMRYRRVLDVITPHKPTTGKRTKSELPRIATNFTRLGIICMGARGYEVSAAIAWAVSRMACETEGLITLHCDEDGTYTRGVRGPCPVVWKPGVAGIEKLELADIFDPATLNFEPTPSALFYLQQMYAGTTIPKPTPRKKK